MRVRDLHSKKVLRDRILVIGRHRTILVKHWGLGVKQVRKRKRERERERKRENERDIDRYREREREEIERERVTEY